MARRLVLLCVVGLALAGAWLLVDARHGVDTVVDGRSNGDSPGTRDLASDPVDPAAAAQSVSDDQAPAVRSDPDIARRLSVRVLADDQPVADAEVVVIAWGDEARQEAALRGGLASGRLEAAIRGTTDAEGVAAVDVPHGVLLIGARSAHRAPALIVADDIAAECAIDLPEACSLVGTVHYYNATRAAGARIIVRYPFEEWGGEELARVLGMVFPATTTSTANGEFELTGLPRGSLLAEARADGYGGDFQNVKLPSSEPINFTLVKGCHLTGRVIAKDSHEPVPQAVIRSLQVVADFKSTRSEVVYSDELGRFDLWAPAAERAGLTVTRESYATVFVPLPRLAHNDHRELTIELPQAGNPLPGTVLSTTGTPVRAGMSVCQEADAVPVGDLNADDDGRFLLDFLRTDQSYRVYVEHADYQLGIVPGIRTGGEPPEPLEFRLVPLGLVKGVVTRDGEPADKGQVRLLGKDQDQRTSLSLYTTIATDGTFEFRRVQPEVGSTYELMALVDGAAPTMLRGLLIDPPTTDEVVHEIALETGVPLSGILLDEGTGLPIADATMQLCEFRPRWPDARDHPPRGADRRPRRLPLRRTACRSRAARAHCQSRATRVAGPAIAIAIAATRSAPRGARAHGRDARRGRLAQGRPAGSAL